ncbi:Uncharacterized conserved protein, DUF488 family [Epilithonimonas bovis DSM 19482]|uniref:Uncharacterized conserved protein, DUF488 family n=1 Tax=Epilithonimonas bovis DSM 19482 TaxID=1121284 RepID=A0A1U7PUJ4_9FLAO|nr:MULTISPECIES: DUF488 domain-containing protein [Epilithonimonas]SIT95438.1 Uncharacterized conserved protein, DUF488 family [Epilithonimonas bovis DSM 19482]
MFYRRKIILGMLEVFGNELEKIRLQKLLFLLSKNQIKPEYDFIPYKYGCYSFSANADLTAMVRQGILLESEANFAKNDEVEYFKALKLSDQKKIQELKESYGKMNANSLMKHTYINFPFWAIKSLKAKEILDEKYYEKVLNAIPKSEKTTLFTIGYEGISLEEYLTRLVRNDVKILIDVRRNPLSMKFGFSKTLLQRYCNALDIEYLHFPEVGIESDKRQELNNQSDYDKLFENYKECNIPNTLETQNKILDLLKSKKRIALTCFEADICQCHRKHLAEALHSNQSFSFDVKHI